MKKELIIYRDPKSPISEVFRTLRTNIQFMNMNKKLKTILVTSTLPGEGKSWVASNLAITFAQAGKNVIIIDADMRKGRQYSIFGVSPKPGLSNFLASASEKASIDEIGKFIQQTEIKNLFIIPAGNVPPNPSELLITMQMANLIEKLNNSFDLIIIDGTPCELVTDAIILSRIVDSTIIVTSYKHTKKANLQKTVKSIENVGGKIAGVVLNKIPVDAKRYEKSYYYGSTTTESPKKDNRIIKFNLNENKTKKESDNKKESKNPITENDKIENKEVESKTNDSRITEAIEQVNNYFDKKNGSNM